MKSFTRAVFTISFEKQVYEFPLFNVRWKFRKRFINLRQYQVDSVISGPDRPIFKRMKIIMIFQPTADRSNLCAYSENHDRIIHFPTFFRIGKEVHQTEHIYHNWYFSWLFYSPYQSSFAWICYTTDYVHSYLERRRSLSWANGFRIIMWAK